MDRSGTSLPGGWWIDAELARGGMGVVWRGHRIEDALPVAIKVLRAGTRAAIEPEVRAVAALDHPNVVRVLDLGVTADGSPFFVMELASGDLRPWRPASWAELGPVLRALLDALAHAHARGVVHTDLKPPNILWVDGAPKLADFGLARAAGRAGATTDLSRSATAGTPRYMAPEQFDGRWRSFGPWTDLYAFGCLVYELVCGHTPFVGRDVTALAAAHRAAPVPPLAARLAVPTGLEAWIRRLLRKAPRDRFQCAADAAWHLPDGALNQPGAAPRPAAVDDGAETVTMATAAPFVAPDTLPPPAPAPLPPPIPASWARRPPTPGPMSLRLLGLRPPPLIGRQAEADALWAALRRVHETNSGQVVALVGAAGYGKTRLAQALLEHASVVGAARGWTLRFDREGGPALRRGLERALRTVGLPRERFQAHLLERAPTLDARARQMLVGWLRPRTRDAVAPDRATQTSLCLAVARALDPARPALLLLDDAQWGPAAWQIANALLDAPDQTPLSLVMTFQSEALAESTEATEALGALTGRSGFERIDVGPLPEAHRSTLVRALIDVPAAVAAEVGQRAAGNPLYARALVGAWAERGALAATATGVRLRPGADLELPPDVDAVWRERIEAWIGDDEAARIGLELAAVGGIEIEEAEWRAALAAAGSPFPEAAVRRGVDRGLLAAAPERGGWRFVHALLRAAWLSEVGQRAATYHRAWATALEADDDPHIVWRRAGHLLRGGHPNEAVAAYLDALSRVMVDARFTPVEVLLGPLERALEAVDEPPTSPRRGMAQALRAILHDTRGEAAAATEAADAVLQLASAGGAGWARATSLAHRVLAANASWAGDHARAAPHFEAALRDADAAADHDAWLTACGTRCLASHWAGDHAASRRWLRELKARARPGDATHRTIRRSSRFAADHALDAGDLDAAEAALDESALACEAVDDVFGLSETWTLRCDLARARGDLTAAETALERAAAFAPPHAAVQVMHDLDRGLIRAAQGRLEEAARLLTSVVERSHGTLRVLAPGALGAAAMVAAHRGDWPGARDSLSRLEETLAEMPFAHRELPRCLTRAADAPGAPDDVTRRARALARAQRLQLDRA